MRTIRDEDGRRTSLDGSNLPGNPLRSFRMSMLAHGFADRTTTSEFGLDVDDRLAYGVVRRFKAAPVAGTIVVGIIIAAVIALAFLFG